jgi:hypothetical protein
VLNAAKENPVLKRAMIDEATKADQELVDPLLHFRNRGRSAGNHWTSTRNNAAFGTDYFTRTAVAKSNIFVNAAAKPSTCTRILIQMGSDFRERTGTR